MSIPLRVGTLALIRSPRTFLGPWLVDVLAIATLCSLTALVDAAARSNSNVGALTVFLVTTAVGLFAVMGSVFNVVRAGYEHDIEALNSLGGRQSYGKAITVTQSVGTCLTAIPLGLLATFPTYEVIIALLRTGGFHGVPSVSPSWITSCAVGIGIGVVLAVVGGWRARPLKVHSVSPDSSTVSKLVRYLLGASTIVGSLLLLKAASHTGLGALFGATLLWISGCVLLVAPILFFAICRVLSGLPGTSWAWPARISLVRNRVFKLSASVTVVALAAILFSSTVSMITGAEQAQREALAKSFRPTAIVATTPNGAPLDTATARHICTSTPDCSGIVLIAPENSSQSGEAYTTSQVIDTLYSKGPRKIVPGGLSASPWKHLNVSHPSGLSEAWHGIPVFKTQSARLHSSLRHTSGIITQPATSWAHTGPTQAILRGSGAADIGPMMAPMLTMALLFAAASAYLLQASFHRTTHTIDMLGSDKFTDMIVVLADALARTLTVYAMTWASWILMARALMALGHSYGLHTIPHPLPNIVHTAFIGLFIITFFGGLLGMRAGRKL